MKTLSKLYQDPKQLFITVSVVLLLMFGLLLSPLVLARTFGTRVQFTYQANYVEPGSNIYPELSIGVIAKDEFPCLINSIFYYSETEEEAIQQLQGIDTFYLVLQEENGVFQIKDVLSSRPLHDLYVTTDFAYFELNRTFTTESGVWQDQYQGIRFPLQTGMMFYAPRDLSLNDRQAILNGTATVDAYVYQGSIYFVDPGL
jgi:hypothetical protein